MAFVAQGTSVQDCTPSLLRPASSYVDAAAVVQGAASKGLASRCFETVMWEEASHRGIFGVDAQRSSAREMGMGKPPRPRMIDGGLKTAQGVSASPASPNSVGWAAELALVSPAAAARAVVGLALPLHHTQLQSA